MCKHSWEPIIPDTRNLPAAQRLDAAVDLFMARGLGTTLYCPNCGKTGHPIKSHQGGIRVHNWPTPYLIDQANKFRERFGFPLLTIKTT